MLPENKIFNSINFEEADLAFLYMGDVFNTSAPDYAEGSIVLQGGNSFLKIELDNVDEESIEDMSGAWKIDIEIPADAQRVVVTC